VLAGQIPEGIEGRIGGDGLSGYLRCGLVAKAGQEQLRKDQDLCAAGDGLASKDQCPSEVLLLAAGLDLLLEAGSTHSKERAGSYIMAASPGSYCSEIILQNLMRRNNDGMDPGGGREEKHLFPDHTHSTEFMIDIDDCD
jgi:hypothetical protein